MLYERFRTNALGQRVPFFENAAELKEQCIAYFKNRDDSPFYKAEQLKKATAPQLIGKVIIPGQTICEIPVARPYTKQGLLAWLNVANNYFDRKDRVNPLPEDIRTVIEWAIQVIETGQIEAALAGLVNPMMACRLNSLSETTNINQNTKVSQVMKFDGQEFNFGE